MVKRHLSLLITFILLVVASFTRFYITPVYSLSKTDLKNYAQNNIMFINSGESNNCIDGDIVDLGDNVKTALNYLMSKGYTANSAAGIVGNLVAESGVVPNKKEGGQLITDESWRLTNWENYGKRGFGIAQWTSKGRQDNLQNFADENGLPVISMEAQLGFLFQELQRYSGAKVENLNSKSFEEATFYIYRFYETPRSSFCTTNDRAGCYNNYRPNSYADLDPNQTSSAYSAFKNRLNLARSALAKIGELGGTTTSGDPSMTCNGITPSSEDAKKIVDTAIAMSWPTSDGYCDTILGRTAWKSRASGGVQACSNTINATAKKAQQAVGGLSLRDCGKFVGAVLIYSNVDTEFPKSGVRSQMAYMDSSKKWTKVSNSGETFSMSNLQPGDVLAYSAGDLGPTAGHIFIWIGEQSVKGAACPGGQCQVNIATASYNSWTPSLNLLSRMNASYGGNSYPFSVYRLAADPSSNTTANEANSSTDTSSTEGASS